MSAMFRDPSIEKSAIALCHVRAQFNVSNVRDKMRDGEAKILVFQNARIVFVEWKSVNGSRSNDPHSVLPLRFDSASELRQYLRDVAYYALVYSVRPYDRPLELADFFAECVRRCPTYDISYSEAAMISASMFARAISAGLKPRSPMVRRAIALATACPRTNYAGD